MSTRIPCWKLRSSPLDSSLSGSLSLLGVESLSWSGVFFDLTVDGDGCLLFLIIGLEGSYSEWSESKAVGGMAGRASSWATGGFWASWASRRWRRRVRKWRKQSCQCQESIFERRFAHHPKLSAPQIAVSSVEQEACCHNVSPLVMMVASLSQCAKGWQPEPCIGHQLQWWQKCQWSTVFVITPIDF